MQARAAKSAAHSSLVDAAGVTSFLHCQTPVAWLDCALDSLPLLLVDHANCEKKAASTALQLLYRYTGNRVLLHKLSRLAREELRHFEQVLVQMQRLDIAYAHVSASRYAASLHTVIATAEPARLIDTLIVGAYIEARSCERFDKLVPLLVEVDVELSKFYASLLKSEARHYRDYLALARGVAQDNNRAMQDFDARVAELGECEARLITSHDSEFRFHSGVPSCAAAG
ncbi:MAG: tRNA isopentenyl-2-thiomethyl-A-37 hydroxylase MiaE [Pseudomonadales bacterium]